MSSQPRELDSPRVRTRVRVRMDVTDCIMQQAGVTYQRAPAQGQSAPAQIFAAITLGDYVYVTYYLAILNDADPTSVQTIDYLKGERAKVSSQ